MWEGGAAVVPLPEGRAVELCGGGVWVVLMGEVGLEVSFCCCWARGVAWTMTGEGEWGG